MSPKVRVRYAPSPTGNLHIGGARTALFNWAFARHHGGVFVVRVEDTDRERSTSAFEASILDALRWLGMDWDEGPEVGGPFGPYRQSERLEAHLGTAASLRQAGWAYPCFCSAERLVEVREKARAEGGPSYDGRCRDLASDEVARRIGAGERFTLRFRVPEGTTRFTDLIRGEVEFENAQVEDWVMVRADGSPTYNFVCVADDSAMEISHVLRGEEHLTNTPKQLLLFQALDLEPPCYGHLPLMLGTDGKKLSKRTGDTSLQDYRDKGYPPEAVFNFLCLQGWALDGETEVFDRDDLTRNFDPADVSKGGSIFDPEKFLWMAGEYVRRDSVERLAARCRPFVVAAGLADEAALEARGDWFTRVVAAEQERIRLYSELPGRIRYLFAADDAVAYDEKAEAGARKHDAAGTLTAFRAWLAPRLEAGEDAAALREGAKGWVKEQGLKFPALFQPLRCALTGLPGGPDLFDVMELLGPEAVLARLDAGVERLAG